MSVDLARDAVAGTPSVLFAAGDTGTCGYFRTMQPALALAARGWRTKIIVGGVPSRVHDVVVGQRIATEGYSQIWHEMAAEGRRLVYELDDDIFHGPPDNPGYRFWSRPGMLARASANMRVAHAVTVSVEPLAQVIRQHTDAPVHVLANCLPRLAFDLPRHPSDGVTVGYTTSDSHLPDVKYEAKGLRRFWARTSARAHFMGVDWSGQFAVPRASSRFSPWSDDMVAYWSSIDFDIGIAPLAPLEFNDSKSPLKAIEYGSRGIPVVASNRGPYPGYVEHGVDGFLVNRDHEWKTYLDLLVNDEDLRWRMGEAARRKALGWVLEDRITEWEDVYCGVAPLGTAPVLAAAR